MMTCWIVMMIPAGEKGVIPAGVGISGATSSATAPASMMRTRAGTSSAPNAGATMKHAPMRMNGQNNWLIHPSSWPCVSVIIGSSVDEHRDVLNELARVADEKLQHPGAGDHQRERHGEQLRNERQRHLVDLRR